MRRKARSVTPAEGMRALDRILAEGGFQTVVLKADAAGLARFVHERVEQIGSAAAKPSFDPLADRRAL